MPASLCRFLKAISLLASRHNQELRDYVEKNVREQSREVLRRIVVNAFGRGKSSGNSHSDDSAVMLKDTLASAQNLPIWSSRSKGYLTAVNALAAISNSLLPPWSPDIDRFVHSKSDRGALEVLGVPFLDDERMLRDHVLTNLPANIDHKNKAGYLRIIAAMSTSSLVNNAGFVSFLRGCRLAATREGLMVKPCEIYDHNDMLFLAAFRLEERNHFLLQEVGDFFTFWRKAGLRYRSEGKLLMGDYISCLYAILKRLEAQGDDQLEADVDWVLGPLCGSTNTFSDITGTQWSQISTIDVFPVLSDLQGQPWFRRERMESLASSSTALSLSKIRSKDHIRVCWSQISFTSSEPSSWVFHRIFGSGYPSCAIVWQHLEYLASISTTVQESEVETFLQDLLESYEYLQARLQESKESFGSSRSAVWLNVDKVQAVSSYELQHSWQGLSHLILLSACDAPPLMAVRSFLLPFAKLLGAIGCASMVYPDFTSSVRDNTDSMASQMNHLRLKGFLTDVTFSVKGISLSAHKIVLAAKSGYCKSQFNGSWNVADVIKLDDMTPHTLENLIDYAYQDSFDWSALHANADDDADTIADKLDLLLEILVGADRWLMQDMKADVEQQILQGNRLLIRADNVRHIKHVADEAKAKVLERYCEDLREEMRKRFVWPTSPTKRRMNQAWTISEREGIH